MSEPPIVRAETTVGVITRDAKKWFLSLETHPERYQFETHAGFAFTQGNFGATGARFETLETFYGFKIALHFELTDISTSKFHFRLMHLPVWGAFIIEEQAPCEIKLSLDVGANTWLSRTFLGCPLIEIAVQRQIQGEVDNIKASMESIYGDEVR